MTGAKEDHAAPMWLLNRRVVDRYGVVFVALDRVDHFRGWCGDSHGMGHLWLTSEQLRLQRGPLTDAVPAEPLPEPDAVDADGIRSWSDARVFAHRNGDVFIGHPYGDSRRIYDPQAVALALLAASHLADDSEATA